MKAVWYDDLALGENYSDLRTALELSLGELRTLDREDDFIDEFDEGDPELYVLDFQLEDRHGVDIAREVLARKGDVPILFLSEYLEKYPDFRARLDPRARIETIFKPLKDPLEWARQDLAEALLRLRTEESRWKPDETQQTPEVWALDSSEFENLSLEDQLDLMMDATEDLKGFTAAVFESSDVEWVVLVGPRPTVALSGGLSSDPPPIHVLESLQKKFRCVPIVVFRPVQVEIIGESARKWTACTNSDDRDLKKEDMYPALSMLLNGHESTYHLDTGSAWSFLSYEDAIESGAIAAQSGYLGWYRMTLVALGESTPVQFSTPQVTASAASTDGGWVAVAFKPRVVRNWRRTSLARLCPYGRCETSTLVAGRGKWCGFRKGLVGRDLLRLNKVLLVLDSIRHQTFVVDDPTALAPLERTSAGEWQLLD